ncbi:hypothetical protein K678_07767 [Magnetospirillum fulvum MGU-K5]|uniref:Uncharacterized protein n=1 Tax=Magnetospirillum fulvum MGU-K5 TaxID=1316936 RepID=S9SBI7_MAGFU|nr:hypothetical protein K678_07767 [Magnetospirillum fulvum MGU-K5]
MRDNRYRYRPTGIFVLTYRPSMSASFAMSGSVSDLMRSLCHKNVIVNLLKLVEWSFVSVLELTGRVRAGEVVSACVSISQCVMDKNLVGKWGAVRSLEICDL